MDQWEGQNWRRSPGNLFGDAIKVHFDPASSTPIRLLADKVIPPITLPTDTDTMKYIRFQSTILTKWWGQPIYVGAAVQLPPGYDEHPNVKYPIVYNQGHFSLPQPGGRGGGRGAGAAAAPSGPAPRMI